MRPPILWATALLLAAAWCPPLQAGRDPDDIRRLRNTGETQLCTPQEAVTLLSEQIRRSLA